MDALVSMELDLLHRLQDLATPITDAFWSAVSFLGDAGIFWILLTLVLLCFRKTRKAGVTMAVALILGLIFGNGLMKNVFARPRPYDLDPTLTHRLLWREMSTDFSFPSGHTLASFEGAVGLFLYHRKWGVAALGLAGLIMLSRLFLLVHYPTDLLAGALFGTLFALAAREVTKLLDQKFPALFSPGKGNC